MKTFDISYARWVKDIFSSAMNDKKKDHTVKLLNMLTHLLQPKMFWFFSDEKKNCQYQTINSQNNRWLALFLQDENQTSVHIMVFGVVTSNGNVIPSFIFPHGLKFNTEAYSVCYEKISATTSPLISSCLTP